MRPARYLIVALVLLILLISGCGGTGQRGEEGYVWYRTGSQGLVMNFFQNSPQPIIYEGDIMSVSLELWNKGTSPINIGQIWYAGFDRAIIPNYGTGGTGDLPEFENFQILTSRDQYNNEGGVTYLDRKTGQIFLPEGTPRYPFQFMVFACYDYQTVAPFTLCIDPEPWRTNIDKPCVATNAGSGSQGAPVAVTNVDQETAKDTVRFKITISNVGGGTIVDKLYTTSKCPTSFMPSDIDKVYLDYVTLSNLDITSTCQPQSPIRLNNGVGTIYCLAPIEKGPSYSTILEVGVSYGYKQTISKQVEVRST